MKSAKLITLILLSLFVVISFPVSAKADIDARDYIAAPAGTDLLLWYYKHISSHNYYVDSNRESSEMNFRMNLGLLRYVHYFQTGSFITLGQVIVPFGDLSVDGAGVGGTESGSSGIGDAILSGGIFLINNPASKTYLGLVEYVSAPTGNYQNEKSFNMGNNRWAFKTELAFSQGFGPGFVFDLMGSVEFYTKNNDYTTASNELKQDPVFHVNAFLSKDINKDLYASVGYLYHGGGKTKVDGDKIPNSRVNEHQVQIGTGYHFTPNFHGLVTYTSTVDTENGIKGDTFGIRFMYAF
jgi:hypothetical protein